MWMLLLCSLAGSYDMVGPVRSEREFPKVYVYVTPDDGDSWEMLDRFEEYSDWNLFWSEYQDRVPAFETMPTVTAMRSAEDHRTWIGPVTPEEVQAYLDKPEEELIIEPEETVEETASEELVEETVPVEDLLPEEERVAPPKAEAEPVDPIPSEELETLLPEAALLEKELEVQEESEALPAESKKVYTLYVYTLPGCAPCHLLKQELDAQTELRVEYYSYPICFTDGTRVQKFPSMELFCGSEKIHRYIGYVPVSVIKGDVALHEAGSVR